MKFEPSIRLLGAVLLLATLAGCGKKSETSTDAAPAKASPSAAMPIPDVGHVETVKTTATGYGASASEAVSQAIRMAILQVNGASIESSSITAKMGLDIETNDSAASMRAEGFAETVRTRSGGVVQNFRMIDMDEPILPKGKYKATIEASISKFAAPADLKKIKLAIAPLRFDRATITIGDRSIPANAVGTELHQRIVDALVNTGRFAVLDRDFDPEVQQELDMIAGGSAPSSELAKLSQAVSADVIWIGRINGLAYNRFARQLRTSDRQLVSYSGGWSVSQKLVNVATKQVMASDTLNGNAPSTEATTLSMGVDSVAVLRNMTDDLVQQVVASILSRTFPITVVSLDGPNAVLSQGGQALRAGSRYAVVVLGKELTDPQTGQSLGRVESPCCQLVIDRVTPTLSYGHLEGADKALDQLLPGALQVREQLKPGSSASVTASGSAEPSVNPPSADSRPRTSRPPRTDPVSTPSTPETKEEKW